MKVYPLNECRKKAQEFMDAGARVYQQFNCGTCGAKQTIDEENKFFTHGRCDVCGMETDLRIAGCNYAVIFSRR